MSGEKLHPGINLGHAHGKAHEQSESVVFGFWVFLMSDLIVFGILFATHAVQADALAGGPGPKTLFNLNSAAMQTGLLLMSSYTYAIGTLALKHHRGRGAVLLWLAVTALLGAGFLFLELRDFVSMVAQGGVPQRSGWLSAFWALVGLHGLHITVGLIWITVMVAQILILGLTETVKPRLLLLGLYWHFLDLIWIGIFTLVFLWGSA